jgi:hypothetical protein
MGILPRKLYVSFAETDCLAGRVTSSITQLCTNSCGLAMTTDSYSHLTGPRGLGKDADI